MYSKMKLVSIDTNCNNNKYNNTYSLQIKKNTPLNVLESLPDLTYLITSTAQPNRRRATLALFNKLKQVISWNKNLEVIIRNRPIPGSNILDLIIFATHDPQGNQKPSPPIGWKEFVAFLRQLDFNPELYTNKLQRLINDPNFEEHNKQNGKFIIKFK